jgi:acylphosphatase
MRAARRLGLTGTVRNMSDGTVEAIAQGDDNALAGFRAELERGPSFGRVDSVHESVIEESRRYPNFDVAY